MSAKRAAAQPARREAIAARAERVGTRCEVPWCRKPWTEGHEPYTRARSGGRLYGPGSITDVESIRLVCHSHNVELTLEVQWGYALGFLVHSWDDPRRNAR